MYLFGEPIQSVDTPRYLGVTQGLPGCRKVWAYWYLS